MDTLKIGKIINSPQNRDAVHMAIVPIEAGQSLSAGVHVGISGGRAVAAGNRIKAIGIVDPFLTVGVNPEDKFWLFLYPGSITSLRHAWTHPAFGDIEGTLEFSEKQLSVAWMHNFCEKEGLHYGDLLFHTSVGVRQDLCDSLGDNKEFARNFSIITGKECPDYFSCAC